VYLISIIFDKFYKPHDKTLLAILNRPRINLIYFFLFFLATTLNCKEGSRKDCYQLQTNPNSALVSGSPVILDDGIVGYIEEVQERNKISTAKFCLPSALRIPKNSKVYVGFIEAFSVYGVNIVSSSESEFVDNDEPLYALEVDSIQLNLQPADTVLTNKLIDTVKDINEAQKKNKGNN
jgi:hypothetical protein